jgi:FO synthase
VGEHKLLERPLPDLVAEGRAIRDAEWGTALTYSRKVFIPLTQLCRDVCHYCTFAKSPRSLKRAYLSLDEVLRIAQAGVRAGCKEALFTLGDKPELRYRTAREELQELKHETTLGYLGEAADLVRRKTGLLPHLNPGLMGAEDFRRLRPLAPSMGLMLETSAERLSEPGGPHHGSPDKVPELRLQTLALAGEARVPFTTGLLIGIGETREERIEALLAINALHARYGHIQEVIIQNFRAKPRTRMENAPEPSEDELLWTIAVARILLASDIAVQTPPNLNPGRLERLIGAGINDWGGISPVTIDHVNPEAAWPAIRNLEAVCERAGHQLIERLTAYPRYVREARTWIDPRLHAAVNALSDSEGLARDCDWSPGEDRPVPGPISPAVLRDAGIDRALGKATGGLRLDADEIVTLFGARGAAARAVCEAADELRRAAVGDVATYVINRNINYTNICSYACSFCAFSKTSAKAGLRDKPYLLAFEEVGERSREAWDKGATEVCLQGGIHPEFTGETYLEVCRAVKRATPDMHIHAFSPLEVRHGAETLGRLVPDFLRMLKDEGLGSLPGTAAEILHDDVRREICPDKLSTEEWLAVIRAAHEAGLPTTSTIMFGHVDRPHHWAAHILALRDLQMETGGFTEFVPLPFVHMASPLYVRDGSRKGPTWREVLLMHAIGRLALYGAVPNIQASWVKLGVDGVAACLQSGCNDLGGLLMNESISRAAGASHGQGLERETLEDIARSLGREPRQRTTLYRPAALPREPAPCYV